jgi:superfamily II DNA/RNA helicase
MAVYQKRLVSSVYAIRKSIENRIQALSGGGADGKLSKLVQQLLPKYRRDPEMLTDQAREQVERELEQVSFTDNPEELEQELEILEELRDQARQVRVDSKAQKLQEFVNGILESDPDEKILIFTEYTDTLEYLRDEVFSSYRTAEIYGDLGQSQRRKQVERFEEEANLMLATDAAREGLNLQFAHIMVNYDLPWNPNRIDQRIGRLHRYGQDETVKIHNLFVDETRESEILERLLEKIDEIESQLGLSSDVLGLVLDDFNLEDEIMTAVASHKEVDDVIEEVEQHITANQADVTAAQEQLTAAEHESDEAETKKIRELIARSEENTVLGDEVRQLLRQFFAEFGGTLRKETGTEEPVLFHVEPPKILQGNSVDAVYEQVTFDRETAVENPKSEFMSIEHELVEALLAFCSDEERAGGLTTVKTAATDEPTPGIFFTFRLECIDGVGDVVVEELFQTYITLDGELHDLPEFTGGLPPEQAKSSEPVNSVINKHEKLQNTAVAVDREKAIETRIENTKAYFDAREERLNADLESYQEQDKQDDKDMSALINKRRRQLEDINSEREQVLAQLETKQVVACEEPKLVSIAVVVDGLN